MKLRLSLTFFVLITLSVSCAPSDSPLAEETKQQNLEQHPLCLVSESRRHHIEAEYAVTGEQRAIGLMNRENLETDSGMLFYYPTSERRSFWMFQTLIPLDIAFIASDGEILQVFTMQPCDSDEPRLCVSYPSRQAFRTALEMNAGYFNETGFGPGDYLLDSDCERVAWENWNGLAR
ncbi:DUF192 domain-containing protein [Aliidiomarina minuta]|nr:DUF192 domain-containing protein [Aliidiomarina minuta]